MWLSSEILRWYPRQETASIYDLESSKRAYDIWNHAEELLSIPAGEFHLVDAIGTLKRAMDHRLRLLDEIYNFKNLPITNKSKWLLERLGFLGAIRPFMLKSLLEVRNALEHRDATPPTQDMCLQYLDIVWYFLRSTDYLARVKTEAFVFYHGGNEQGYKMGVDINTNESWEIKINADIPKEMLSSEFVDGWMEVHLDEVTAWKNVTFRYPICNEFKGIEPDDLRIKGMIVGPDTIRRSIYEVYLSVF
ncbi:hypothetical protein [Desulfitobacterium sp. PCE1]|uniref:hypothetical protein n=1 Tax=Desulfitobacterium sp. PCE1 TaxID=146907 RepID=UPI0003661C86|nr:hypothetical protein [Desulfitobacterium sp. PCE1]